MNRHQVASTEKNHANETLKVLVIANPNAGRQSKEEPWTDLCRRLRDVGTDVCLMETTKPHDATDYAIRIGSDYDIVCACGGDGTLSEVVGGLMTLTRPPYLAFLPIGSTCDVANTFGLSADPRKASETILYGPAFSVDIGKIEGSEAALRTDLSSDIVPDDPSLLPDHFTYVASFGAFTETSYATPRSLKKTLGHLAYMLEGLRSLSSIRPYSATTLLDGTDRLDDELVFGSVINSSSIGGMLSLEGARFDDGRFEILLVRKPGSLLEIPRLLTNLLGNKDDPLIIRRTAADITFEFTQAVSFTVDGEYGGTRVRWDIRNQARALRLKVPELPHPPSHRSSVKDPRPTTASN